MDGESVDDEGDDVTCERGELSHLPLVFDGHVSELSEEPLWDVSWSVKIIESLGGFGTLMYR